jgi:tRNA-dihydrouridine synthase B
MKIIPAPMAGYTDFAFRQILAECGADEVWTEMISAAALTKNSQKTLGMIKTVKGVRNVVQLFGCVPEHFAQAVSSGALDGYDEITINMGCPAPKITKEGSGCTLMRNLALAKKIITAASNALKARKKMQKPQILSVKMRLGWNKNIAIHFARMCEECGAERIILHGRLGEDGYSGAADWTAIAEAVKSVKIPVIANGDIVGSASAQKCLAVTNAGGVMIGRGLLGRPWRVNPNGETPPPEEVKKIIARHIALFTANSQHFPEFKKHALYYCNSLKVGKQVKQAVAAAADMREIEQLLGVV